MYTTILLAVALQDWDRHSTHALTVRDVSAALAQSASTSLHVLSVYQYDEPPRGTGLPFEMAARAREDLMQRTDSLMQRKLDDYISPLQAAGLKIVPRLEVGNPREVIVRVATDIEADLLVIGSHSKRGMFDVALGGTARQVSSQAPCPLVLVVPHGEKGP